MWPLPLIHWLLANSLANDENHSFLTHCNRSLGHVPAVVAFPYWSCETAQIVVSVECFSATVLPDASFPKAEVSVWWSNGNFLKAIPQLATRWHSLTWGPIAIPVTWMKLRGEWRGRKGPEREGGKGAVKRVRERGRERWTDWETDEWRGVGRVSHDVAAMCGRIGGAQCTS